MSQWRYQLYIRRRRANLRIGSLFGGVDSIHVPAAYLYVLRHAKHSVGRHDSRHRCHLCCARWYSIAWYRSRSDSRQHQLPDGGADSPDNSGQHRTEPDCRHHLHLHGQPSSWDKCIVAEYVRRPEALPADNSMRIEPVRI